MDQLVDLFNRNGVRYLVIGGQAVRLEGMPRFSMDWDIYIPPKDLDNLQKINRLLEGELDLPLLPMGEQGENFIQTYQTRWGIVQFHLAGPGLPKFDDAESRAVIHETENRTPVKCLSIDDLIESKRKTARPQDSEDVRFLEKKKEVQQS
ncbi:MAG: hypothetical protein HY892_03370 [Deltaproteobacteria bacterium]|nr:hypothetical protein [Deltaproteobacteria bacterium]